MVVVMAVALGVMGQSGRPVDARGHDGPAGTRIFASGFDNPRGLALGPDGQLYVAEAGSGGRESTADQCPDCRFPGRTVPTSTDRRRASRASIARDAAKRSSTGFRPASLRSLTGRASPTSRSSNGRLFALVQGGGCSYGSAHWPKRDPEEGLEGVGGRVVEDGGEDRVGLARDDRVGVAEGLGREEGGVHAPEDDLDASGAVSVGQPVGLGRHHRPHRQAGEVGRLVGEALVVLVDHPGVPPGPASMGSQDEQRHRGHTVPERLVQARAAPPRNHQMDERPVAHPTHVTDPPPRPLARRPVWGCRSPVFGVPWAPRRPLRAKDRGLRRVRGPTHPACVGLWRAMGATRPLRAKDRGFAGSGAPPTGQAFPATTSVAAAMVFGAPWAPRAFTRQQRRRCRRAVVDSRPCGSMSRSRSWRPSSTASSRERSCSASD